MARILEILVGVLMLAGTGLLVACVSTTYWRSYEIIGEEIDEGLLRVCRKNKITKDTHCDNRWGHIDEIDKTSMSIICTMMLSLLFMLISMITGMCSCCCRKAVNLVIALIVFLSVGASSVGLGLYLHYYMENATLEWSYYIGWGGTGSNMLAVVFLLAILMR